MPIDQLLAILRDPAAGLPRDDTGWNSIVREARRTQLLGQLGARLANQGLTAAVPLRVREHFSLALLTAQRRGESALWEVATLRRALGTDIPLVLLKGCAYLAAGDANAAGRHFSDVDILVPRPDLERAEGRLVADGWMPGRVNAHDERYYREWMHELPPMEHVRRHTTLDVHHAIVPPVSRFAFATNLLLARCRETSAGVFVLDAPDRVIHCAVHLLQEGAPEKLLRELFDLFMLLEQHAATPAAAEALKARAEELGLAAPFLVATGAARTLFAAQGGRARPPGEWLERCLVLATRQPPGEESVAGRMASLALVAYSHWMKMPWQLLVPHLARKLLTGKGKGEATLPLPQGLLPASRRSRRKLTGIA